MRITKLDDYQSWMIEVGAARLLVDPWLTPDMAFPLGMFRRERVAPELSVEILAPTHVLVTAPFGDHLHAPSLSLLARGLPVMTTPAAARRIRRLGFADVRAVHAGEVMAFDGAGATLTFLAPGFPYSHNSLGCLIEEPRAAEPVRLYLETHVVGKRTLAALPRPIDLLLTTAENVRFFGVQLAMDTARAAKVAAALGAKRFVPTGVDPGKSRGVLPTLLYVRSDRAALARSLAAAGAHTSAEWLAPGQSLAV